MKKLLSPDDLMTASEIAEMCGVKPSAVSNWQKRDTGFPEPWRVVSDPSYTRGRGLWLREEVEAWWAEREAGRVRSVEERIAYHETQLARLRHFPPSASGTVE